MTSALVKDESMLTTYFYGSHSIYTVWVDNQPLFNSQDVCRALGYENTENGKKAVQRHVANTYKKEWRDITAKVGKDLSLPFNMQPKSLFLTEPGLYCFALRSNMAAAKKFSEWVFDTVLPAIRKNGEYTLTKQIKDKDNTLALLTDELDETQRNFIMLETDNEQLQRQNEILQRRTVPRIGKHDNILCAIQKNEPDELGKPGDHPYYMIRCQRMRLQKRLHIKELQYPNMVIKRPTYDAANAVICWVEFQKYIGKDSYYRNHFSLDNNDHRDFFANTFDIDM